MKPNFVLSTHFKLFEINDQLIKQTCLLYISGTTNYYTGFFLGFSVYVSNSTYRHQGKLCYKDSNFTLETIPAVINVVCPVHGQYVIYYNERLLEISYPESYKLFAENNVCEIEVYGKYF